MAEKKKKGRHTHTHVEHHKDGSHTIHHVHSDGPEHDVKHAAGNLDELHDSMQDHIGVPNEGEAEAEAGQHGVPEEHAVPAGLPMPSGMLGAGA